MLSQTTSYAFAGFGISGYRCFLDEPARIGPFGKIHLITGKNNSGKSALADVAVKVLPLIDFFGSTFTKYPFNNSDVPQKWYSEYYKKRDLYLCFSLESLLKSELFSKVETEQYKEVLISLLKNESITRGDKDYCWFGITVGGDSGMLNNRDITIKADGLLPSEIDEITIGKMMCELTGTVWSPVIGFGLRDVLERIIPWDSVPRKVIKLPALRKATADRSVATNGQIADGSGLVNQLLHLSNPKAEAQYESGRKWNQFVAFVRDILNDKSADVLIDADATTIQVRTDGADFLALENLGTGIEELVILAAVVSCNTDTLFVIEEPEIHLHPTLQAKIVKLLSEDENGNRFIITTHSPTIINAEGVSITQVVKENGVSRANEVHNMLQMRDALDDIGARPSDLLQSNYIVWVEGPSDRIYVNYWLSVVEPGLREGIHYSVMLYGGRLLNSLTADADQPVEELIALFRINTHFCVLIDSDKKSAEDSLNETKRRIVKECESAHCMAWVTCGKTIENYIPQDVLHDAIEKVHGKRPYKQALDNQYVGPLDAKFEGAETRPDKIRIARAVVKKGFVLGPDLKQKVVELAGQIRRANCMEPPENS